MRSPETLAQYLVVALVVGLAAVVLARRLLKAARGKDDCGCGKCGQGVAGRGEGKGSRGEAP